MRNMAIILIKENGEYIDWTEEDELDLSDVQFISEICYVSRIKNL